MSPASRSSSASQGPYDGIFVTLLRALIWLLVLDFVRRVAYRQAASSVGIRTARLREWLFRTILVAVLPLSFYYAHTWDNLCYSASLMLLICHLYFKATDAPPPEPQGRLAFNHLAEPGRRSAARRSEEPIPPPKRL